MEQIFRMIQAQWKGGKLGHDQLGTYIQQRGDIMELQIPKKIYAKTLFFFDLLFLLFFITETPCIYNN